MEAVDPCRQVKNRHELQTPLNKSGFRPRFSELQHGHLCSVSMRDETGRERGQKQRRLPEERHLDGEARQFPLRPYRNGLYALESGYDTPQ